MNLDRYTRAYKLLPARLQRTLVLLLLVNKGVHLVPDRSKSRDLEDYLFAEEITPQLQDAYALLDKKGYWED